VTQALVSDAATLKKVRTAIKSVGFYGVVSADQSGYDNLPYAENLIKVVVVEDYENAVGRGLSLDEIFRVLAPCGSVYLCCSEYSSEETEGLIDKLKLSGFNRAALQVRNDDNKWFRAVKPWPQEIDEWTPYLHDADGNPVVEDWVVAPP
jgi:hypothetical protein